MILLNLLCIQLIWVLILDISGFMDSVKLAISKFLTSRHIAKADYRIKPFDCSLCMTFWTGLIYIICLHQFTIPLLAYILFIAVMTPVTKDFIILIRDLLIKLIDKIYTIIS
jgi:hypothetical protein